MGRLNIPKSTVFCRAALAEIIFQKLRRNQCMAERKLQNLVVYRNDDLVLPGFAVMGEMYLSADN